MKDLLILHLKTVMYAVLSVIITFFYSMFTHMELFNQMLFELLLTMIFLGCDVVYHKVLKHEA